jgi:catechol 2,3-dioxygenase-like lactoylglutathione lyase family enzyme
VSLNHIAITTKNLSETHRFYSDAVGFTLVKVDVIDTPTGGWMKHAFYDTGDGSLLAVVEFHDETIVDFRTALSTGLGLPTWANHIAFGDETLDDLEVRRHRLLDHGLGCMVMDHDIAISLYAEDPNGIMIEFSTWVHKLTDEDRVLAEILIHEAEPEVRHGEPPMEFFDPAAPRELASAIVERARQRTNSHAAARVNAPRAVSIGQSNRVSGNIQAG